MKKLFSSNVSLGVLISNTSFLIEIDPLVPIIDNSPIKGAAYEFIIETLNVSYSNNRCPVSYDVPLFEIDFGK